MNVKHRLAATMLAAVALAASGAGAQSVPGSGDGPISFGADDGEYTPDGLALRGRAEIVQGDTRIRADRINGYGSTNRFDRIEANGNVYFVTPDQSVRGDRAVYTLASNEIVVTGDVILTQGQNVLTGARLVYNTRTQAARIEGSGQGGRIRGVFYPNRN